MTDSPAEKAWHDYSVENELYVRRGTREAFLAGWHARDGEVKARDAILDAGFRRPREVTTVEELDALPVGSMIREADGFFRYRDARGWILVVEQEVTPNENPSGSIEFPAAVVFEPEKEA